MLAKFGVRSIRHFDNVVTGLTDRSAGHR